MHPNDAANFQIMPTTGGRQQLPEADTKQQYARDRQKIFRQGHHDLVDAQARQRPAHPHHHQDQKIAFEK